MPINVRPPHVDLIADAHGGIPQQGAYVESIIAGANITVSPIGGVGNVTITASSSGTVTTVTGSAPISSSGGSAPNITVANATTGAVGVVELTNDFGGTATAPTVLSTHLSSPLPIAQGGTSASTAATAISNLGGVPVADYTAKGVLLAATAASTVASVHVGADGLTLTADSTQPSGVNWIAPGSTNFDAGTPDSSYGAIAPFDCGGPT